MRVTARITTHATAVIFFVTMSMTPRIMPEKVDIAVGEVVLPLEGGVAQTQVLRMMKDKQLW